MHHYVWFLQAVIHIGQALYRLSSISIYRLLFSCLKMRGGKAGPQLSCRGFVRIECCRGGSPSCVSPIPIFVSLGAQCLSWGVSVHILITLCVISLEIIPFQKCQCLPLLQKHGSQLLALEIPSSLTYERSKQSRVLPDSWKRWRIVIFNLHQSQHQKVKTQPFISLSFSSFSEANILLAVAHL